MATIKEKTYLLDVAVQDGYTDPNHFNYCHVSKLTGLELANEMYIQIRKEAVVQFGNNPRNTRRIWISFLTTLCLGLLFICPTFSQSFQTCQKLKDENGVFYSASFLMSTKSISIFQLHGRNPVILDIEGDQLVWSDWFGKSVKFADKEYKVIIEYKNNKILTAKITHKWKEYTLLLSAV